MYSGHHLKGPPALRAGITLAASRTSAQPVTNVEDEAEDHEEPAPTAQVGYRAVGKNVEQGRIRKEDQPEQWNDEAAEGAVHQVREDPHQHEHDSWRES